MAISCLDTRYLADVSPLISVCDEFAYYRNRIYIEIEYFKRITGLDIKYNPLNPVEFTQKDFQNILSQESVLRHDVKAIEYFIKDIPEISNSGKAHLVHIGLTSQDICSPAFIMCFDQSVNIILEQLNQFITIFKTQLIPETTDTQQPIYMLGLTHGQPATPTAFQKEMLIYSQRLENIYKEINTLIIGSLTVKFGGATGEFNAMCFTCPEVEWVKWCDEFIQNVSKGRYRRSELTNQCDDYDSVCIVLYVVKRMLHILEHLRGNIWLYINRGYLTQRVIPNEIGSSTMPNKVNPIDLENAKTAIEMGKRMIDGICDILNETSFQRDVSDSSAVRNIASVFGYVLVALKKMTTGIGRLQPNWENIKKDLVNHPEVILEGIQTYLKYHCGIADSYEIMKAASRGRDNITLADIHSVIDGLGLNDSINVNDEHKTRLKSLTPETYIGTFSRK